MLARIREIEDATSSQADDRTIMAVATRLRTMPAKADDELGATIHADVWMSTLADTEMNGPISADVMTRICREYLSGRHGKWRPSTAEFVARCKEATWPLHREAIEIREYLGAPVVTQASPEEMARKKELVKRLGLEVQG